MATNIKDFVPHNKPKKPKTTYQNNQQARAEKEKIDSYEDIINKYKNYDNDSLMSELLHQADDLKKQGKLSAESLQQLYNVLSPMLNAEQNEMLKNLIAVLK